MNGEERITVHEAELVRPQQRGRFINAFCHIHGSDHQRSLHINAENGFGKCHACGAQVFVPELNPDGAHSPSPRPRRVTAEALLRPPRRQVASDPAPEEWQRAELAELQRLAERLVARLNDERALAYLAARRIPYDIAAGAGVGYIPADAPVEWREVVRDGKRRRLQFLVGTQLGAKWRDRLMFPLGSPAGVGYAGRSLAGWVPGMDEDAHKALLEVDPKGPRRWEKTYPAGWMGYDALATAAHVVMCEGPLDRLALVAAGLSLAEVVALVGTAARPEWLDVQHCPQLRGVVLALDYDKPESRAAAEVVRLKLRKAGLAAVKCAPPAEDKQGKDWSERWRLAGRDGVVPVEKALNALRCPAVQTVPTPVPVSAPPPAAEPADDEGSPPAPWLANTVVCYLLEHGLALADARLLPAVPEQPVLVETAS